MDKQDYINKAQTYLHKGPLQTYHSRPYIQTQKPTYSGPLRHMVDYRTMHTKYSIQQA